MKKKGSSEITQKPKNEMTPQIPQTQMTLHQNNELAEIKRNNEYALLLQATKEEAYKKTKKEWLDDLNKPKGKFGKLLESLATKTYEQSVIYSKITTEAIRRSTSSPSVIIMALRLFLQIVKLLVMVSLLFGVFHVLGINPFTWKQQECTSYFNPYCYYSWFKTKTQEFALSLGQVFCIIAVHTIFQYVYRIIDKYIDEKEKRNSIEEKEKALSLEFIKHVKNSIEGKLKEAVSHVFLLDHQDECAVIVKYGYLRNKIVDIEQYRQNLFIQLESQFDALKAAKCFTKTFPQDLMSLLTDLAKEKEEWMIARDKLIIQAHTELGREELNYISTFGSSIASKVLSSTTSVVVGMTGPVGGFIAGRLKGNN